MDGIFRYDIDISVSVFNQFARIGHINIKMPIIIRYIAQGQRIGTQVRIINNRKTFVNDRSF